MGRAAASGPADETTIRLETADGRPRGAVTLHRAGAGVYRVQIRRVAPQGDKKPDH